MADNNHHSNKNNNNNNSNSKSEEEQRQQALQAMEGIVHSNRPKNLQQGVVSGVSNVVAGCVGAAGVAVLAPTVGLAAGVSMGGILGGVVGVTGGAVVGAVAAAGLAIGGVATGVIQVIQGVAAVPQQVAAPRQGKWWNEVEGQWVFTDLPKDATKLKDIPEDDSDILKPLEDEVEAGASGGGDSKHSGPVADMYYYDILEVEATADPSVIKRRYYVLARKYHPDKVGADDKESADKFKEIAEAYQVLSDPQLRQRYDRDGRVGLSPDKTSVADATQAPQLDPAILFAFLFGSDKFHDYVGRLATATSARIGDVPKLSLAQARTLQRRRVTRLAVKLAQKLQPWVEQDFDLSKTLWQTEAQDLSTASYGAQLLKTIGKIYTLSAIQFLGALDSGIGLPRVSKWAQSHHAALQRSRENTKSKIDTIKAGLDMLTIQAKYEQRLRATTDEAERKAIEAELAESAATTLLRVLWTTTVVDLTSTLHEAAQMLFFDQSVDKDTRKRRAQGLQALGEIFMSVPDPTNPQEKNGQQMYEEAAFAAMLETIKRKDEAAHKAQSEADKK